MAESELGTAQLRLEVDLDAFRDSLQRARRLITDELGGVARTGSGQRSPRTRAGSPDVEARRAAREEERNARARERAEERRQRAIQRGIEARQRAERRAAREQAQLIARNARQGGAREDTRALEIAQERRFRLARRVDALENRGADVARLRVQLGDLTEAQSRRQFGTFRQISQELARQVTLAERRDQLLRRQQRAQQQAAALGASQGGARESVFALERAQDRRFRISQRIERLEDRGVQTAQLRRQLGELTTSYAQRQFGTARQLSRELERQVALTEQRARRERETQRTLERTARIGGPREPVRGRPDLEGSPLFLQQQERDRARAAAQQRRIAAEQARLRRQEIAEGLRIGRQNASPIGGLLPGGSVIPDSPAAKARALRLKASWEKFLRQLDETQAAINASAEREARQQGGPSLPVTGRLVTGAVVPGSPAAVRAAQRLGAQGGPKEGINALQTAADKAARLQNRLNILEAKGVDISKLRTSYEQLIAAGAERRLGTVQRIAQVLARNIGIEENSLRVARIKEAIEKRASGGGSQAVRGPSVPVSGRLINGGVVPGSPAALEAERRLQRERERTARATQRAADREVEARRKQRDDAIGSGLIGGAFPLLFGQGLGASVGGGVGGVLGGALGGQFGFGLSLVGTAIGAQIDALTQRFIALGEALRDPIANLDQFIQEATLASKSQEGLVKALAETGQTQAAADLIRREASRTLDPIAAEGAAAAQDAFNRTLSDTRDVLGTIVAGPATGFLNFLSQTLRLITGTPQQGTTSPITTAIRSADNAGRRQGLNAGGQIAGMLLTLGGIGAAIASGGLATPVAAGLIGTGLTMTALGTAGAESAKGDARVATSEAVITAELQVTKAKERQLLLESQILDARARGKKGLEDQLTLQAQFNGLAVEEAQALSRIQQELVRNRNGFNDVEDQANADRQTDEVRRQIEARRKALLATASATQTAAARELRDAREIVGVYGTQRGILEEQLKIRKAQRDADDAQQALNAARARGATKEEIDAAGKLVNAAILERQRVELQGQERIRQLEDQRWANAIASANRVRQIQEETAIQAARPGLTGTGVGALQSLAQFRAAKDAEREAQAQLRVEPGNEQLLQASQQASENVKLAAAKTKSDLLEAYQAAKDSVRAISRSIEDLTLNLAGIRGDSQGGLNKFLRGQALNENLKETFDSLLPQFKRSRELAAREAESRGNYLAADQLRDVNFSGPTEGVIKAMIDFIQRQRAETRLEEDIARAQLDLIKSTNDLTEINKSLSDLNNANTEAVAALTNSVQLLTQKDWQVYVTTNFPGNTDLLNAVTLS